MEKRKIWILTAIPTAALAIASICLVYCTNMALEGAIEPEPEHLEVDDKILILSGYIGAESVDIRVEPTADGEVVGTLGFNEKVEYKIYNSDWFEVVNRDTTGYISSNYVLDEDTGYSSYEQYALDNIVGYTLYDVPKTSGFKSYMDYRSITSKESPQYKLQNRYAQTGDYGIRMVEGRYCVAVGSHFTEEVGQYLDLILENGVVIPCILADQKSDAHTDSDNIVTLHSGCCSEFVVEASSLSKDVRLCGDISECCDSWDSRVVAVKVYNKNIFG